MDSELQFQKLEALQSHKQWTGRPVKLSLKASPRMPVSVVNE